MASKKYIYRVTNRAPRARSKRLRAIGAGSVSSTVISLGGSSGGGTAGEDGFSPTISFETEGSVLTVRVVNKTGIKEYEIDLGECTGVDALREDFEECCREMTEEVKDLRDTIDELKRMMNVVTFTVVPTPADAKVTINGEERVSVSVFAGAEVEWRVEADGYITRTGSQAVTEDTTLEVVLADLGSLISSFSYDDIGAGGGFVLPKVEVLEGAALTYSGTGVDKDTGEVSADSLGTTLKARTRVTAVTLTAELNGSTATASADVYQEANEVVRHEATGTTYGKPAITGGHTYDDISAGGGTVTPAVPAYNQVKTTGYTDTYTSGATAPGEEEDEIIRSGAAVTYSGTGVDTSTGAVTASSLGTTLKARTKVATSTVTVTMNGQSASKETDVYQEENKVESESSETTYSVPSVSLSYEVDGVEGADIPAGGGTARPVLSYSQTRITGHSRTYTSGEVETDGTTETITSGAEVTYGSENSYPGEIDPSTGAVSAGSLGTTVQGRSISADVTATVTLNGKTGTAAATVWQQENKVETTEESVAYGAVEVLEFSYPEIPASGGTVLPDLSYRQQVLAVTTRTYTSGETDSSTSEAGYVTDSGAPEFYIGADDEATGAVTAPSLGTEERDRTCVTMVFMYVVGKGGSTSGTHTADVYQEENKVERSTRSRDLERLRVMQFIYPDIPGAGGTVYPETLFMYEYEDFDTYTYTSGESRTEGNGTADVNVTPDELMFADNTLKLSPITLDTATGAATAGAATSTERQSLTTVTATASYTSPQTGEKLTDTATAGVWQEARETWLRVDPDSLTFGAEGGSASVGVDSSTGDFAIEGTSDSWLSTRKSVASGKAGEADLTVTASANTEPNIRRGTVTLSNGDGCTAEVAVAQAGDESPTVIMRTLTVDIKTTGASSQGGGLTASPTLRLTCGGVTETVALMGLIGATEWTWSGEYVDGSVVSYEVSMDGYTTVTGSVTMDADRTVSVALRAASGGGGLLG